MFLTFLKFVGLSLLGELFTPKPELQHAKPRGLSEFSFPTAQVGRPAAVIFGKVRQRSPNLLWYGDYIPVPVLSAQKIKKLFKSKTVYQVTGHRHFVGMHFGLGVAGVQAVHKIWAEERLAWAGSITLPGSVTINQPNLWGGINDGGGMVGQMEFLPGGPGQGVNGYLAQHLNSPPAFRPFTTAVWHRGELGNSPRIPPLSFELSRYPALLGMGAIGEDSNPAEILWETLVNQTWGLGAATTLLDPSSFTAGGTTLASEGLGLSLLWDQKKRIGDFCHEILRTVDGVMYPSLRDAKVKLKLARGDYDTETIPVVDPSNAEMTSFSRTAWQESVNELRVLFTSRASGYRQDVAPAFDLANFDVQGVKVDREVRYEGVHNPTRANELAWRDLRALSTPLAKGTWRVDRRLHRLEPGAVFLLRWPSRRVLGVVMRVTKIRPGAPGSGKIEMDAIQDVFSLGSSSFADSPASEWTEPVASPTKVVHQRLAEVPYQLLAADDGSASPGTIDPDLARVQVLGARPVSSALEASIETRVGADPFVPRSDLAQFTPTATLVDPYPADTAAIDESDTLVIQGLTDVEVLEDATAAEVAGRLRNLALLGDEWIAWETLTDNEDGTWTLGRVWRGAMDTVPAGHSAGARIWFASEGQATTPDTYALGVGVDVRLVPSTARGELDPGDADVMSHTITTRSARPYPPGDVQVNGSSWPEAIEGDLVVTWAHRDRTQQPELLAQDAAGVGPEAGVTYTLRIYGEADTLLRTETGISAATYTYTGANATSDAGRLQGRLRIELEAVRGGLASHQHQEREVLRAGYGLQWGRYYGGLA